MEHWIFISSTKRFRMDDWLSVSEFVEFTQHNKVCVNDIVYLYTTAPVKRIEYKMIVDKINIPAKEGIDDSAFDIYPHEPDSVNKLIRLRLLEKVDTPKLHLSVMRNYGLKSSMQGNIKVSGPLLEYIDSFFSK